jgi:hypothetical protein
MILEVAGLTMRFGGLVAVDAVSFTAMRGEITALIGPNGAGKTTVFNCITGFYRPSDGAIRLHVPGALPVELHALAGHNIARAGVARSFQNIRLFPGMTALENLLIAQHNTLMAASGWGIGAVLGLSRYPRAEREAIEKARRWLTRRACWSAPTTPPARSPTARSGAWRSPAPCARSPRCSAWTSPRPASTRASRTSWRGSSWTSAPAAPPSCSSSTTWAWSCGSATASWCWTTAS